MHAYKREKADYFSSKMGDYVHCYSDYVHHILNNSPSKKVFTFSKAPRFPSPQPEESPEDVLECPRYRRENKRITSKERAKIVKERIERA